jgi:predicted nucleotidyltransferase
VSLRIEIDHENIAAFCRRSSIRHLSFFGSVLRDDFGPESDVDVLVEFEPGAVVGYFGMTRMERELSELIDRKVDFRTPLELSRYLRGEVIEGAQEEYVAQTGQRPPARHAGCGAGSYSGPGRPQR